MGYNRNRYAKFSTKEKVLVKSLNEVRVIVGVNLDLTNDQWMYRLNDTPGWFPDTDLERLNEERA